MPYQFVNDSVIELIKDNPSFFNHTVSNNKKIQIFCKKKLGIIIPDIPVPLESITRSFRKHLDPNVKNYNEQENFKEAFR